MPKSEIHPVVTTKVQTKFAAELDMDQIETCVVEYFKNHYGMELTSYHIQWNLGGQLPSLSIETSKEEEVKQARPVPTDLGTKDLQAPLVDPNQSPVVHTPSLAAMTQASIELKNIADIFNVDAGMVLKPDDIQELLRRIYKVKDLIEGRRRT